MSYGAANEEDLLNILASVEGMLPAELCSIFGFLHASTKPQVAGTKRKGAPAPEEVLSASSAHLGAEEMERRMASLLTNEFCAAFNSADISAVLAVLNKRLATDCSFPLPLSGKVLRGVNCVVLLVAMLYYAYPDCIVTIEDESFARLNTQECATIDVPGMLSAACFTLNFTGTLVSPRPLRDMVSGVKDKALRDKLSHSISRAAPATSSSSSSNSSSSSSDSATTPAVPPTPSTKTEVSGGGGSSNSSSAKYAELFLLAAEVALKGEAFTDFEYTDGGVIDITRRLVVGYNAQGRVVYWKTSQVS